MAFSKKPMKKEEGDDTRQNEETQANVIQDEEKVADDVASTTKEPAGSADPKEEPTVPDAVVSDGVQPGPSTPASIRTRHTTVATDGGYSFIDDYDLQEMEFELDEYFDNDNDEAQEFIENTFMERDLDWEFDEGPVEEPFEQHVVPDR